MKLLVLFAQRKESYDGEYAPEVLACWDEYTVEENQGGWDEECARAIKACGDQLQATRIITIEVNDDKVREMLIGSPTLKGTIAT